MKKLILFLIIFGLIILLPSCKKFDETKTDELYAQIVVKGYGKINLKLSYNTAPITVTNFIKLSQKGFYEKTIFHRVIKDFMIQGGGYYLSNDAPIQKTASTIKGEFSSNGVPNKISHKLGVISMARVSGKNDSASSQFFICSADCTQLDGEYAAFGWATDDSSKNVILKISNVETITFSSSMQNYPSSPITITKIKLANKAF